MRMISENIQAQMEKSSWIRKMFEKGAELKQKFGAESVFDFSLGNPDIPPPANTREILIELAGQLSQSLGMGYCPNAGLPVFRAALAEMLSKEQQAELQAAHVVVTCGAAGALTAFFRAVLEPGDEVITPAPYFVEYGAYCAHFGGLLRPVPSIAPAFQLDLEAIKGAVCEKTRVVLINSPNNPTGCIYSKEILQELGAWITKINGGRERPVYLVSDEPYRFLAYDGVEVPPVLPLTPFALVLGSFSKKLSIPGERVGYLVANPQMPDVRTLINAVTLTNRTLGFVNAPVIGQRMALQMLDAGVDIGIYQRRRDAMAAVLRGAGINFSMPAGAFYFFPEAPGGDDVQFVSALLQRNILAVPGTGFGYPGYFRLSFSVQEDVIQRSAPAFKEAVASYKLALSEIKKGVEK
ncbi:MAG: pyridoxal phosphate-dependent aminotransferase [Kiritimatiellae bacterium]|nr:pyridoxal phosphate-dependent aminotransferase [Kiritimatiellia bacterium]